MPSKASSDRLDAYDFHLPASSIAQTPASQRDASRLMRLTASGDPTDHVFRDLPGLLQPGDCLVRNDTRVIPARLHGTRSGGGRTELLLVHRLEPATDGERWLCLGRPSSHLKPGRPVAVADGRLVAVVEERCGGGRLVMRFDGCDEADLLAALEEVGEIPLPPYIVREGAAPSDADRQRYQTTYAREAGAVAAPTAGLHFTPEVEAALAERGIEIVHLTLHVGPGTFRPIKVDDLAEHVMDAERYVMPADSAARITAARQAGRRIIAVGSTSTRVLETVTDGDGVTRAGAGWSELFIRPGYTFRGIDGMVTNFHLPRSSLLVMVAALMGRERILQAYQTAVERGYRFYSYGDASLLLPGSAGA